MKTIKVSDATNIQLDWLVAKCEGHAVVVLTIQEQRDRWFEDVPPENLEKETTEYDLYFAPTVKPKICIASEGGYKRTPHHSEAPMLYGKGIPRFQYSTSWSQMGPIIEQERISITFQGTHWWAAHGDPNDEETMGYAALTPLIAAARCYIVSKLGEAVEVPEELA